MIFLKSLILCVSTFISVNEGARILGMFPVPSISHQVVFRRLTLELAKRGHELVVITTDPAFSKENGLANHTEIDVHDISYSLITKLHDLATGEKANLRGQIHVLYRMYWDVFEAQFKYHEVQDIINDKSQKFDLILLEACVRPALALTHIYKVPTILISSFFPFEMNNYAVGAPTHPILYPSIFHQRLFNLTSWEKIKQVYDYLVHEYIGITYEKEENKLLKKMFPDIPPLSELANNVDMLFVNTHSVWQANRPVPPGVIYVGGLHVNPEKQLPQDLQNYLDSSKRGVVYMSLGTNVKTSLLSPDILKTFINVFAKLPYDVLWKFDKDEFPGISKNVKLSKWLPQSDLLRHPKIKLFITQGGLQSSDEAITAGVPVIGIPMLADQWYNAEQYEFHKVGLTLSLETITEEQLYDGIMTVTEDESYRNNMVRLRALIRDQPQSSLERAVWWTEHVLRHGGARHLRAPAANMSWRQFLELDLVLSLLLTLLVAVAVIFLAMYYITQRIQNVLRLKMKQS